jgi:hypothetical protein
MRMSGTVVWFLLLYVASAQTPTSSQQTVPEHPSEHQQTAPATSSSPPQSKIDPAKEADIRQFMEVAGVEALMTQMMETMADRIKPLMATALPPGDYRDKLIELFFLKFKSKADAKQLLNSIVPLYDKYLSDKEIKELIEFYQTPLGQKTVQVMPKLMSESEQVGRKWGEELGRQSMVEVLSEHPELGKALEDAKKPSQPQ